MDATVEDASAPLVLRAQDVHKRVDRRHILRGVDLSLGAGRTIVLLGPNGAGKTTLLRILSTLSSPSSGTVNYARAGADLSLAALRAGIGVMLDGGFYEELSGRENLLFAGRLHALPDAPQRADEVGGQMGLARDLDRRVGEYSRGMMQRLSLGRALLHKPPLLFLDEPESGLDQEAVASLPRAIRADGPARRGVVVATHDQAVALSLADDVAFIVDGQIVFAAPASRLTSASLAEHYQHLCGAGQT